MELDEHRLLIMAMDEIKRLEERCAEYHAVLSSVANYLQKAQHYMRLVPADEKTLDMEKLRGMFDTGKNNVLYAIRAIPRGMVDGA